MRGRDRAAAIGVSVVVAYLLLLGGTSAGMVIPEIRILTLALATVTFLAWVLVATVRPAWRPRSVFVPVLIVAMIAMAISAALSRSPRIGAESLAQAVLLGNGYLLLVELARRPAIRSRVLFVAAAIGLLLSVAYVGTIAVEWSWFWLLIGQIGVPPLRPDNAGLVYQSPVTLLAIVVMLGAVLAAAVPPTRAGAVIGAAGVSLAALAAVLTGTRAGWLAVAISLAATGVLALCRPTTRRLSLAAGRSLFESRTLRLISAAVLSATVLAAIVLAPAFLRRISAGGEDVRTSFYAASLRMFVNDPIAGIGPGLWPLARAANSDAGDIDFFATAAHDVYLQTIAEMGILGIAAALVAVAAVAWLLRDGLRDSSPGRARWAWVATFTVLYFGIHGSLDFYVNVPAVLLAAVIPIAILDATAARWPWPSLTRAVVSQPTGFVVGVGLIAVAIGFAWWTTPATILADQAARAGNAGHWVAADELALDAARLDPGLPQYELLQGLTAAQVGDEGRALAALSSFAEFSDMPEAWVNVAALRLRTGDQAGARNALDRASRLGLQHPAIAVVIADLAVQLGDDRLAIDAGAAAVSISPSLIADPWWSATAARAAIQPKIVAKALDLATSDRRWEIELMRGEVGSAARLASDSTEPTFARDVIAAWLGDGLAADRIFAGCLDQPLDGPIGWCARLATRAGNQDEAERYRRLAGMLHINGDTTGELRIYDALSRPSASGSVSSRAGGAWRQLTLWDVLVPGMPRIDVAG